MLNVSIDNFIEGISHALDAINPALGRHHRRTAVIALRVAETLNLRAENRERICHGALLHDIGIVPLRNDIRSLGFEADQQLHAIAGWALLRRCPILCNLGKVVRYHHTSWNQHEQLPDTDRSCARYSAAISLADSVDLMLLSLPTRTNSTEDTSAIMKKIAEFPYGTFCPEFVEALGDTLNTHGFWEDFRNGNLKPRLPFESKWLNTHSIVQISTLFSYVIDSISPFTATHSSGVAEQSRELYRLTGATEEQVNDLYVAGLLHDIGKLGVPAALLEKPGKLTDDEFTLVKRHAEYSYNILTAIPGMKEVGFWGSAHHERLDGKGYPFAFDADALPLQARIIAVADVLTAISEDRPYRVGMEPEKALNILSNQAKAGALDKDIVDLAHCYFREINTTREREQAYTKNQLFSGRKEMTEDIQNIAANFVHAGGI